MTRPTGSMIMVTPSPKVAYCGREEHGARNAVQYLHRNIDKDATAVELRVDIGKSSLPSDLKERLIAMAGRHVTTDGVLVIVSRGAPFAGAEP